MNNITKLTTLIQPQQLKPTTVKNSGKAETEKTVNKTFKETVMDFVNATDSAQKTAGAKVESVIMGDSENLHEAMAALEESRLNFQLMMEIRNKLLESFKEIQRMPV